MSRALSWTSLTLLSLSHDASLQAVETPITMHLFQESSYQSTGDVQALPQRRQTMLFTATVTEAVQQLQDHVLKAPCVFKQYTGPCTASNLREQHVRMQAHVKELYLVYILQRLQDYKVRSGMIFCGTKETCEFIGNLVYQLKHSAVTLHSGKKQKARLGSLNKVGSSHPACATVHSCICRTSDCPKKVGDTVPTQMCCILWFSLDLVGMKLTLGVVCAVQKW